ncbi:glycoside hydrolase family 88 protein [Paenibacillus sp. CGMCC 1.16610]|uniref:Glycosyl hydrolase family 88 n=1 Tax=Paenibacillus anseongense TaxID=2682845 RepID=A0ABW9U719_9BACL|nr:MULTISPECIES: glycoside hydrolase family 88 protein [Paenibacillus]MBA2938670.1 glycoside hydrolase family 88 protein [Paenibacillus sp. CGMCC 1.16610]MVQ34633.1 glycosyl hydrolase family 88 [Paenibacillus anseongense]
MKASMLNTKIERMSVKVGEAILSHSQDGYHPKMANQWGYVAGMALAAIDKLGDWTGDAKYHDFVKRHMDVFIQEDGSIRGYKLNDYNLDHINKGKNLFRLWRETGEAKYEAAARLLITQLVGQPRTSEGGFWHKKIYPFQMWLDGLYMSSPFMAEYAHTFQDNSWFDEVAHQLLLVERHTRNPQTGLLHHAWDETQEQRWCANGTGQSRHVWGRAMGWYAMALVDALEYFPIGHPKRGQLMGIFERMVNSVVRAQDQESGVWYQVMDCNGQQGNYLESSGSCMLTYAIAKGIRLHYLAEIDRSVVERAYEGILQRFVTEDEQGVHLHQICHGAGLGGRKYRDGSYAYYLSEAIVSDVLMGVAPLLLATLEMEQLRESCAE